MLVVILVALASVIGYALLATTSIQAQIADNTQDAANADTLAESGMNVAMYYLQNPSLAGLAPGKTYWEGQSGMTFGSTVAGTCDVAVTPLTNTRFKIRSTGRPSSASDAISRTIESTIELNYAPAVNYGIGANANLTVPGSVTLKGDIAVKGTLRLLTGAKVDGVINAVSVIGSLLTATLGSGGSSSMPAPVPTSIPSYRTYSYGGTTYTATELTGDLADVTLGPTSTNPAGIYYWTMGTRKLNGNVVVNGTLINETGNIWVNGGNNSITAVTGFPGLVVGSDLVMASTNRRLTVNGMVYLKGRITATGGNQNGSKLIINGGLLMSNANPTIDTTYNGTINVTYKSSALVVTGVGSSTSSPQSVSVMSWN
jgi:hypothetical protein